MTLAHYASARKSVNDTPMKKLHQFIDDLDPVYSEHGLRIEVGKLRLRYSRLQAEHEAAKRLYAAVLKAAEAQVASQSSACDSKATGAALWTQVVKTTPSNFAVLRSEAFLLCSCPGITAASRQFGARTGCECPGQS